MTTEEKLKQMTLDELVHEIEKYIEDKEYLAFIREEIRSRMTKKFKVF